MLKVSNNHLSVLVDLFLNALIFNFIMKIRFFHIAKANIYEFTFIIDLRNIFLLFKYIK